MANLTKAKTVRTRPGGTCSVPMLTGVTIAEGALVNITAAGFATNGSNTAGARCLGTAMETVTNPGASGAVPIKVSVGKAERRLMDSNFAAANFGFMTYVGADDSIISLTKGNGVKVGRIIEGVVGDPMVWVQRPAGGGPVGVVMDATFDAAELPHFENLI